MTPPFVRRSRLVAAEANVTRLSVDNDNLRATVANLTTACEHYVSAIATLQRMLAQQQVTMVLAPWAAQPADKQEATDARS